MDIIHQLIADFGLKPFQVENTLALFDEGATVPFVARYRKERTGSLDEIQLRDIQHKYQYYKDLDGRRKTILDSIREQGKLTPELETKITATLSKTELEDLYLPFKPKRITRGKKARDAGLEPLAQWLFGLDTPQADILAQAAGFVNAEAGFDTPDKALAGACDILAEDLSDNAEVRKRLRDLARDEGFLVSKVCKEFEGKKSKFEMYYAHREKVAAAVSHRVLAMLRGEREHVLAIALDFPRDKALAFCESHLITHPASAAVVPLKAAAADALDRLLAPATETEIRAALRESAEEVAFDVFGRNLRELLLAPPAGRKPVLGIDPGFRTGCKLVALDATGKFLHYATVFPHEPQKKIDEARAILLAFIQKYAIELIAIGNGTASRETDAFVRQSLAEVPDKMRPVCVVVNESGASVYSASDTAIAEFPDFDVTVRGAVSIARRLQDPLSELVKIDPKAIGVGQYQHDVNQGRLKQGLDEVVESCVNLVGVDLNLASEELLKYVSGLNRSIASRIVKYRNERGAFGSRENLRQVPGLGPRTFEQAAGFLRIPGAANPLDNSSVHPERYDFVVRMAETLKTGINELIGNTAALHAIDKQTLATDEIGLPTIEDILAELEKPGRDPRAQFRYAHFDESIREVADLKEGMSLEGTVTNVTNFGAFVDIGVHQDGLVHISELGERFVKDPNDAVKVGQVVKVRVLKVDTELKRIALSMKPLVERPPRPPAPPKRPPQPAPRPAPRPVVRPRPPEPPRKPRPAPPPPRHATLADLQAKWGKSESRPDAKEKKLKTTKLKFSLRELEG